jgi:hypothetical protein
MGIVINKPANGADFEKMCCHIATEMYQDNDTQIYGRSGQTQWGIDIRTKDSINNKKIVIQCKAINETDKEKIKNQIVYEFIQAFYRNSDDDNFSFNKFIYAATIDSDVDIIDFCELLEMIGNSDNIDYNAEKNSKLLGIFEIQILKLIKIKDKLTIDKNELLEKLKKHGKEIKIWTWPDIITYIEGRPRLERLYAFNRGQTGAELINKEFINTIQGKIDTKVYTPSVFKFYSRFYYDEEQWCGIIKGWDATRQITDKIKKHIEKLINTPVRSQVIGVINGVSGSGKSTVLRRIAIDIAEKSTYSVWWIENIQDFLEYDFKYIDKTERTQKHLLIIEDWDSADGDNNTDFFNKIGSEENIRVLIGNTKEKGTNYDDKVYEGSLFKLDKSENSTILDHIAKIPGYEQLIFKIKQGQGWENIDSLFMLVYVIAYNSTQANYNDFELRDIVTYFKKIINKNLEEIEQTKNGLYKGLGKAIILASKIYKDFKVSFTKNALLQVAKYLGDNPNILRAKDYQKDVQSLVYIKKLESKIKKQSYEFIYFNHDSIPLTGVLGERLEDFQLEDIYNALIHTEEEYTSALLVWVYQNIENINNVKIFDEFLTIFDKYNDAFQGKLSGLIFNKLNKENKAKFAKKILSLYPNKQLDSIIIMRALDILKDDKDGKNSALEILTELTNSKSVEIRLKYENSLDSLKNLYNLEQKLKEDSNLPDTLNEFITHITRFENVYQKAISILNFTDSLNWANGLLDVYPKFYEVIPNFGVKVLNILKKDIENRNISYKMAEEILSNMKAKFKAIDQLSKKAFELLIKSDQVKYAEKIWSNEPECFMLNALGSSMLLSLKNSNSVAKIEVAKYILSLEDIYKTNELSQVYRAALSCLEENEIQDMATNLLNLPKFYEFHHENILQAFKILKKNKSKQNIELVISKSKEILEAEYGDNSSYSEINKHLIFDALSFLKFDSSNVVLKAAERLMSQVDLSNQSEQKLDDKLVEISLAIINFNNPTPAQENAKDILKNIITKKEEIKNVEDLKSFYASNCLTYSTILKILKNNSMTQNEIQFILERNDLFEISNSEISKILNNALEYSVYNDLCVKKSFEIISERAISVSWHLLLVALKIISKEKDNFDFLKEIYAKIEIEKDNNRVLSNLYDNLIQLPLYFIDKLRLRVIMNLKSYSPGNNENNKKVYSILACYEKNYLDINDTKLDLLVEDCCIKILKNWKSDINSQLKQNSDDFEHIRLALCHPELEQLSIGTAEKIVQFFEQEENTWLQRKNLYIFAKKITNNAIYYKWGDNN